MRRAAPLLALSLTIALPASLAVHPTVASSAPDEGPDVLEISDLRLLATGLGAPSDVAVGEDGTVYVLDGYGGFLHRYAPDGTLEDSLEVQGDPVGVGWGGDRVWVPRTDEAVVMAFEPATGVWHSHTAPDASSVVRFTDAVLVDDEMALVSQGGKVWMTPLTGAGGEWVSVTSTMPFLADATSDGQLVMADVQDDTIHMAEPGSVDWQQVAQWGVWEGGFLHPTGVAVDRRGRIFVADGFLGVVQVFNRDGDFLGALGRDEELLRLEHPMGVAVDGDHLYVCDWVTGQVLAMEVDDRTRPVTRTGLYRRKLPRVSYLESSPSPEQLLIPVCQTCHDGSVQNSAHVWDDSLEQHPVDIIPHKPVPPPFTVDDQEQLYCGTCHIPHRMGDAVDADAELMEVFLKEPRARSQLCRSCHTDVVAEVRHLTEPVPTGEAGHALGQVPRNVARTGVQAIDPEVERVECLDCHAAHGAVGLLLVSRANDQDVQPLIASMLHGPGEQNEALPQLHVTGVVADDLLAGSGSTLAGLQTRIDEARAPVAPIDLAVTAAIDVQARYQRDAPTMNVVAILPGTDGALAKEHLVIGGHLDHVGQQGDIIYPGANDNASGAAAVLAIARAFVRGNVRPKRTVVFVLFAGEEQGIHGAEAYVADPALPLDTGVAMLNTDCPGEGDALRIACGNANPELWGIGAAIAKRRAGVTLTRGGCYGGGCDGPFDAGWPTLCSRWPTAASTFTSRATRPIA